MHMQWVGNKVTQDDQQETNGSFAIYRCWDACLNVYVNCKTTGKNFLFKNKYYVYLEKSP